MTRNIHDNFIWEYILGRQPISKKDEAKSPKYQRDIPHTVDVLTHDRPHREVEIEGSKEKGRLYKIDSHLFPAINESVTGDTATKSSQPVDECATDTAYSGVRIEDIYLETLKVCPPPLSVNSGARRVVFQGSWGGDNLILAVEEIHSAGNEYAGEKVIIGADNAWALAALRKTAKEQVIDIVSAMMFTSTGTPLYLDDSIRHEVYADGVEANAILAALEGRHVPEPVPLLPIDLIKVEFIDDIKTASSCKLSSDADRSLGK